MTPFELLEPATLPEAIGLLDPDDPTVRPIAGGTALMLMMKAGVFRPTRLVSLRKLAVQHSRVAAGENGALTIGALTPLAAVERSPEVANAAPVITRAMRRLSNIRVRNVATVGGNLAHGDPHMDLPPVLIALGAEVVVAGSRGERRIAVEDLFAGFFETVLAKNELIAELRIPAQGNARAAYLKVTTGSAEDWPALGVAVALAGEGAAVKSARVVVSAATEKAVRLKEAEKALAGATIGDKTLARAADAAADEAECISDVRGSAAYKRELVRVYVGRAVRQAVSMGLLIKGGGHAMAAGVTLRKDRLSAFRAYLEDALAGAVEAARREDALLIDGALTAAAANNDIVAMIARAGPFGAGNPEPVIAFPAHTLVYAEEVGQSHVRARLRAGDGSIINAIAFRAAGQKLGIALGQARGQSVHAAGTLCLDRWNGTERVQLRLIDAAPADASLGAY